MEETTGGGAGSSRARKESRRVLSEEPEEELVCGLWAGGVSGARGLQEGVWVSTHEGQGSGRLGGGGGLWEELAQASGTEGRTSRWAFRAGNSA